VEQTLNALLDAEADRLYKASRKELEAAKDPEEQDKLYHSLVAMSYEHGKAINMDSFLEIDDVIDPKDTRRWIMRVLNSLPPVKLRSGKKRPYINTW
jgi:acetyl-CoA carboxylase carboxyltransferase component